MISSQRKYWRRSTAQTKGYKTTGQLPNPPRQKSSPPPPLSYQPLIRTQAPGFFLRPTPLSRTPDRSTLQTPPPAMTPCGNPFLIHKSKKEKKRPTPESHTPTKTYNGARMDTHDNGALSTQSAHEHARPEVNPQDWERMTSRQRKHWRRRHE